MDMLSGARIAEAGLADWRKLAQGLHARYLTDGFGTGARFLAAVADAVDALGHHPVVTMGAGHVDLKLTSADAVYREASGTEHVVEWVTERDVELARRISAIAGEHGLAADPSGVTAIELGLDAAGSATIAPVWAALLTGDAASQGRGSPSDEIRDATARVPNLWFGDAPAEGASQRLHVEVYVAAEEAPRRLAAVLAAGGTVVDDSQAPALTVVADQEGNRGVLLVDTSAVPPEPTTE